MDVPNNPYTRLVALEQGLREILNDSGMTMPQTAAAIFFLADVDAVEKCLLAKERNKDAHDLLQGLIELRDKADESMRGPVVKTMTVGDVADMERNHKEMQKLATELIELIEVLKPHIGHPEPSIANPLQILSAGNAAIANAQKAVSDTLAAANQALSNGEQNNNADRRVESKFPKPDDSLTDDAIEYLKKSFHKLPHAGTAKANHVIAAAVRDGMQRNAVEWALVRMQEYGWIKLSIPVWGGVIGNHRSEPKYQTQEGKPTRWYFGTQEYNLRLTEYFYNPSYCRTCSKLIGDYDYDRTECHDCRSPQGKLAELEVAVKCQQLYGNDDPERIREWPAIRAYLRDKFGPDRTNMQLWEWMTDHLRVLGWDQEQWLRMKYGEFIELLKSGLLNERQPESKVGSVVQSSAKVPLYDDDVHVGMVDLSELTKLCTSLLRQDNRQGTLYRDDAGRFIYHVWDYDDKIIGRTCRLMRPADAYEVALKADQFFVASAELIAELAKLKLDSQSNQSTKRPHAVSKPAETPNPESSFDFEKSGKPTTPPPRSLEACEPAERKAYYSFKLAETVAERRLEDREAYDLLVDGDYSEHFTGELADYKPPGFTTWARQLRTARKATNERKYTPRTHK